MIIRAYALLLLLGGGFLIQLTKGSCEVEAPGAFPGSFDDCSKERTKSKEDNPTGHDPTNPPADTTDTGPSFTDAAFGALGGLFTKFKQQDPKEQLALLGKVGVGLLTTTAVSGFSATGILSAGYNAATSSSDAGNVVWDLVTSDAANAEGGITNCVSTILGGGEDGQLMMAKLLVRRIYPGAEWAVDFIPLFIYYWKIVASRTSEYLSQARAVDAELLAKDPKNFTREERLNITQYLATEAIKPIIEAKIDANSFGKVIPKFVKDRLINAAAAAVVVTYEKAVNKASLSSTTKTMGSILANVFAANIADMTEKVTDKAGVSQAQIPQELKDYLLLLVTPDEDELNAEANARSAKGDHSLRKLQMIDGGLKRLDERNNGNTIKIVKELKSGEESIEIDMEDQPRGQPLAIMWDQKWHAENPGPELEQLPQLQYEESDEEQLVIEPKENETPMEEEMRLQAGLVTKKPRKKRRKVKRITAPPKAPAVPAQNNGFDFISEMFWAFGIGQAPKKAQPVVVKPAGKAGGKKKRKRSRSRGRKNKDKGKNSNPDPTNQPSDEPLRGRSETVKDLQDSESPGKKLQPKGHVKPKNKERKPTKVGSGGETLSPQQETPKGSNNGEVIQGDEGQVGLGQAEIVNVDGQQQVKAIETVVGQEEVGQSIPGTFR